MAPDHSDALSAALRRLEESRDRLLLAQTRMAMATEQAERSLQRLTTLVSQLDRHPGNPGADLN